VPQNHFYHDAFESNVSNLRRNLTNSSHGVICECQKRRSNYLLIFNSTFGTISIQGTIADRFGVGEDFDGLTFAVTSRLLWDADGKSDIAVWRPDSGIWYILTSGTPGTYTARQWGLATDVAISPLTSIVDSIPWTGKR
jgi:hypothetical protein